MERKRYHVIIFAQRIINSTKFNYIWMSYFPNESDLHLNDMHLSVSQESFLRMERMCELPRILLNDSPLNMTINRTLLNQSVPDLNRTLDRSMIGQSFYESALQHNESIRDKGYPRGGSFVNQMKMTQQANGISYSELLQNESPPNFCIESPLNRSVPDLSANLDYSMACQSHLYDSSALQYGGCLRFDDQLIHGNSACQIGVPHAREISRSEVLLSNGEMAMLDNDTLHNRSLPDFSATLDRSMMCQSHYFESSVSMCNGATNCNDSSYSAKTVNQLVQLYMRKAACPRNLLAVPTFRQSDKNNAVHRSEPDLSTDFKLNGLSSYNESKRKMREICSDLRTIDCNPEEKNLSFMNMLHSDSKSSAYFSNPSNQHSKSAIDLNAFQNENSLGAGMTDGSAYYSNPSLENSSSVLRDSLDCYHYRRFKKRSPVRLQLPEISPYKRPNQRRSPYPRTPVLVTSSPIVNIDLTNNDTDDSEVDENGTDDGEYSPYGDSDAEDPNNTLEMISHFLYKNGFATPSPTRLNKRRLFMEEYVADLLQQKSTSGYAQESATNARSLRLNDKISNGRAIQMVCQNGTPHGGSVIKSGTALLKLTSAISPVASGSRSTSLVPTVDNEVNASGTRDKVTPNKVLMPSTPMSSKRISPKRTISIDNLENILSGKPRKFLQEI